MARSQGNSRDLRVQKTYKLLKEAFVRLLSQKPFERITVQEICEEAMVRRTTFYQHFEDKHDFLNWFIREMQQEFTQSSVGCVDSASLREYSSQVIRNVLRYLRENESVVRLLSDAGVQGRLLTDAFARACVQDVTAKLGQIPDIAEKLDGVPAAFLAEFYVGGIVSAARWWFSQDQFCSEEDMARYIAWAMERVK